MSKTYLIVGGNSGIGLSLAKKLSEQNHTVLIAARTPKETGQIAKAEFMTYDATSPGSFLNLEVESLDGLVYCPGSINLKPFGRLKEIDFINDFQTNVIGAVRATQEVLPLLKKGSNPAIVFFSTVAVAQGMDFHSSVAASKGAVEGLSKSLAAELAPHIRVNTIAPSVTDTPLANRILSSEGKKEASAKRHPLNKYGAPEDIAHLTAFLLSEEASWITGQVIGVDGGLSSIKSL